MNKSEVIAEKWIIDKHGEKPIFQSSRSPDFLVNGSAYEVKVGRIDRQQVVHINLSREQVERVVEKYPQCHLLVVTGGDVDILTLPQYESHPQKIGDNFVIHWLDPGFTGVRTKRQVIHFDDDLQKKIDDWRGGRRPIPPFKTAVVTLLKEKLEE